MGQPVVHFEVIGKDPDALRSYYGDLFGWVWMAFQWVSTIVGFLSAMAKVWPMIRRLLGPEPATET